MEDNKNVLFKKVPDKVANIAKGLALILIPIPFLFILWIVIVVGGGGFLSDIRGPDYSPIADFVVSGIYLIFLILGILQFIGSHKTISLNKTFWVILMILVIAAAIMFFPGLH